MDTKFIFNRKSKLNQNGTALIQLQINGTRIHRPLKSTGIYIEPEYWDEKRNKVKKKHPNSDFFNNQLKVFQNKWTDHILSESFKPGGIDWEKIKSIKNIDKIGLEKSQGICFIIFFEDTVMKECNKTYAIGTKASYNQTLNKLNLYTDNQPFQINSLNYDFCTKFMNFLLDECELNATTREKHFKNIKKALNEAIKRNLYDILTNPFDKGFKFKAGKTEPKALTMSEVKQIEDLDVSYSPTLQKTKDMFLFSCYTSIRYCDLVKLSFENFIEENNEVRLKYVQQKTNVPVSFRLSSLFKTENGDSKPVEIYRRYAELNKKGKKAKPGFVTFFGWTNQTYNKNLKDIGRKVNVSEVLTAHVGRYTAITNLLNTTTLKVEQVQVIAGHKSYATTLGYFKPREHDLNNALEKTDWTDPT